MDDDFNFESNIEHRGEDLDRKLAGEGILGEELRAEEFFLPSGSLVSDFCSEEIHEEAYGEQVWAGEGFEEREKEIESKEYEEEVEYEPEEEEITLEQKISLDSEYLKSVLGTPLTFALLEIASRRPSDPIQYLGHYLINWRWCGENKKKYEEKMKELNAERNAYLEKVREKERQEMLEKEEREEELRRIEKTESSEGDMEDIGEGGVLVDGE